MQNINDFKKQSLKLFTDKIIYELQPFEEQRLNTLKKCKINFILFILLIILNIILLSYLFIVKISDQTEVFWQIFLQIDGLVILWFFLQPFFIAKAFERNFKKRIMPEVFKQSSNFKWQDKSNISTKKIESFKLFDRSIGDREDDDCFNAQYKDINIDICETKLSASKKDSAYFKGVLICLSLKETNYKGLTLVRQTYFNNLYRNLNKTMSSFHYGKANVQRVYLEDVEFEKEFNVFSSNQIEARYILTTSFIERFKNLANIFSAEKIEASFFGNNVMIALYSNNDLFKLASVTKPVYSFNQYKTMIDEFASIFELIDELKFTDNIGL